MKGKTSRRALLMSALSLLLCVCMLAGTTFAWFTDEVTSQNNIIKSGNLDVVLEYWDGDSYEEVTSDTKLFSDDALWEPGYTEIAYLKVSNAGSLALKYQLAVNVYNEITGKTKDNTEITLSEHLQFKVVESDTDLADTYTRETARDAEAAATKLRTYTGATKALEAKNEEGTNDYTDYVALIIYMPETVGNEANHNGTDIPRIEMGVTLLATQQTAESDSFGSDYDEDAEYPPTTVASADELKTAVAAGGIIKLTAPVTVSETISIPTGVNVTITGESLVLSGAAELISIADGASLTLEDVTLDANGSGRTVNVQKGGTLIINEGAKLIEASGSTVVAPGLLVVGNVVMNGGEISDCTQGSLGSAVYMGGGTFTMNGGKITGCVSKNGGGAVAAQWNSGTFIMNGGEITGNQSRYTGAIQIKGITVQLNGGKIYDNTIVNVNAEANPSNVTLTKDAASHLSVSGSIEIYNTDTSVKSMVAAKSFEVTGALTGKIQVYSDVADFVLATGTDEYTLTEADLAAFENTAEGYQLVLDGNSIKVVAE